MDAVIRNFEVLGETAKYISEEAKLTSLLIEWRKISDFRNVLIHDYFGSDYKIMWEVIQDELPQQFEFLKRLNESYK